MIPTAKQLEDSYKRFQLYFRKKYKINKKNLRLARKLTKRLRQDLIDNCTSLLILNVLIGLIETWN